MKVKEDLKVEFKEVTYLCKCGQINRDVALVFNGYGFGDSHCKKCGKRFKIETYENFVDIRSF